MLRPVAKGQIGLLMTILAVVALLASPMGSRDVQERPIVFESERDGQWEIYVMNPDGSDQKAPDVLPPHPTYIETHLGGGAVLRHKKPARSSIGVDRDPAVIRSWRRDFPLLATYIEADAVDFLASQRFVGDEVVYCDPPYLPSTRRRARVYRHDYGERDHVKML